MKKNSLVDYVRMNDRYIAFNARCMKVLVEPGQKYLMMPKQFFGNTHGTEKGIVNMNSFSTDIADMVEREMPEQILTPSSKNAIIYNGLTVHYCTGHGDTWNCLLSDNDYDEVRI